MVPPAGSVQPTGLGEPPWRRAAQLVQALPPAARIPAVRPVRLVQVLPLAVRFPAVWLVLMLPALVPVEEADVPQAPAPEEWADLPQAAVMREPVWPVDRSKEVFLAPRPRASSK